MIMKVRLEAIHKYRKTKYKNLSRDKFFKEDAERKQLVFK